MFKQIKHLKSSYSEEKMTPPEKLIIIYVSNMAAIFHLFEVRVYNELHKVLART